MLTMATWVSARKASRSDRLMASDMSNLRVSGRGDDSLSLQVCQDVPRALLDASLARVDRELGLEWRLVRCRDAGELLDLAGARLLVEPLHVALLAHLDGTVDEYLDEVARPQKAADLIAVRPVRRDEGRKRHEAGVGEELRHLADAAAVRGAVL